MTSKPSMSGSITSRTTRSGLRSEALMIADRPSLATATSNPANRNEVASSSRMLGSSSTTSSEASAIAVSVTLEIVVRIPGSLLGATQTRRRR